MSDIRVPQLGESIVEATVLNWLVKTGETVQTGSAMVELETDKVNVEVIAEESGVLDTILKPAGESVRVGESIGVIRTGQATDVEPKVSEPSQTASDAAAKPAMLEPASLPAGDGRKVPIVNNALTATDPSFVRATPSMRRMARELGVETLSAPDSVEQRASSPNMPSPSLISKTPTESTTAVSSERMDEERQHMTRRRLTIAKRLVEVQHTAAMLTTFNEVDMTRVKEVRARRKDRFKEEHGVSLGFMSFFTKATVAALKAFPRLNAEIQGEDMVIKYHYDIGVAVAAEGGLVVPVVRDADRRSFAEIEREIAALAEKARDNSLSLSDLQGGTFTITNGGVFGSLFSTPILNAPQVGILGMHGIQERPVAVEGSVEIRPMMYIALSYDHRIVDGSEAVRFLAMIKRLIEDPETLLLEG